MSYRSCCSCSAKSLVRNQLFGACCNSCLHLSVSRAIAALEVRVVLPVRPAAVSTSESATTTAEPTATKSTCTATATTAAAWHRRSASSAAQRRRGCERRQCSERTARWRRCACCTRAGTGCCTRQCWPSCSCCCCSRRLVRFKFSYPIRFCNFPTLFWTRSRLITLPLVLDCVHCKHRHAFGLLPPRFPARNRSTVETLPKPSSVAYLRDFS